MSKRRLVIYKKGLTKVKSRDEKLINNVNTRNPLTYVTCVRVCVCVRGGDEGSCLPFVKLKYLYSSVYEGAYGCTRKISRCLGGLVGLESSTFCNLRELIYYSRLVCHVLFSGPLNVRTLSSDYEGGVTSWDSVEP